MMAVDPVRYDAWYESPRGQWIGQLETALIQRLARPAAGASLLDVGAGTGYFSRQFTRQGLEVTALDPSATMLGQARARTSAAHYVYSCGEALPFDAGRFDYCSAVTSLCFSPAPEAMLSEMWRVCRRGVILGLLNRHSLLYRQKAGHGNYRGARWDTLRAVTRWLQPLQPRPRMRHGYAAFLPKGSLLARGLEPLIPAHLPLGAFLALYLART